MLQEIVELRRRGDRDGYRSPDCGAHLGGGGGVSDTDEVRLARRPDGGLRQGTAQRACDGAVGVLGHDDRLTDDEAVRQLHPEHEVGAIRLRTIVDEDGRRKATADPLA